MSRETARRWLPAFVFACVALALFSQTLVGGRVLTGDDSLFFDPPFSDQRPATLQRPSNNLTYDAVYVFEPDLMHARRAIRGGHLPIWSESIGAGEPILAAQQTAPLFPLTWLAFILPFWTSLGWIAALELILAACGAALLCRALGRSRAGAALAGVTYGFSTYLVAWSAHPHANIFALLPWAFWLTLRTVRGESAGAPLGLTAVAGLMLLGGHPGTAILACLGTAAWAAYLLLSGIRGGELTPRRAAGRAAWLVGAGLGGLAIGAVMILPLLELGGQGYELGRGGPALPRSSLLSLAFPEWWGRPDAAGLAGEPVNFYERTAYFGVVPAMLAIAGLFARPRRDQVFFAVAFVAALAIALNNPIASLVREIPGIDDIELRRMLVFAPLSASVLAAYGLDALRDRGSRRRVLWVCAAVAALPLLWVLLRRPESDVWRTTLARFPGFAVPDTITRAGYASVHLGSVLRWPVIGLAFAAGALAAARWTRGRVGAQLVAVLAIGIASLDLVGMGHGLQPSLRRGEMPRTPDAVKWLRDQPASERVAADTLIAPNLANRYGFRDMRVHALPLIERRSRLYNALSQTPFFQISGWISDGPGLDRAPDMFGVGAVYSTRLQDPRSPLRKSGEFVPAPGAPKGIFLNRNHLPRAWVAHAWRPVGGLDAQLSATTASTLAQLRDEPVIEGSAQDLGGTGATAPADPVTFVASDDTRVVLRTDAAKPGYLILADTYYPGWQARVDGRSVPIRAANTAFRAVPLPAGRHQITFSYRPASVRIGWIVSLAAVIALLGAAVAVRRSSRLAAMEKRA